MLLRITSFSTIKRPVLLVVLHADDASVMRRIAQHIVRLGQAAFNLSGRNRATIDDTTRTADGAKLCLGVPDLEQHEMIIIIETRGPEAAAAVDVPFPHLAGSATDEVLNALLWFGSFVDVIVAG